MDASSKSAFFTDEEQLQLLNGNCQRNFNKDHLTLSTGTAKDGSASTAEPNVSLFSGIYTKC